MDVFKKLRQQEEEDKKRQEALRLELEKEDRGSYGKVVISHFQNRVSFNILFRHNLIYVGDRPELTGIGHQLMIYSQALWLAL